MNALTFLVAPLILNLSSRLSLDLSVPF